MIDDTDDELPRYPSGPGYRGGATSRAGALKVHKDGSAKTQTTLVAKAIEAAGPNGATAQEVYASLGDDIPDLHAVRARIAPLVQSGKIVDSGRVRDGGSGVKVKVWLASAFAPPKADDGQGSLFGEAA